MVDNRQGGILADSDDDLAARCSSNSAQVLFINRKLFHRNPGSSVCTRSVG